MLYVTCSVFKAENSEQIEAALSRHADMRRIRITLPGDPASSGGQLLPGGNRDPQSRWWVLYALLEKSARDSRDVFCSGPGRRFWQSSLPA